MTTCAECYHSVKSNLLWMWMCGYGQSLKADKYSMKILLCEAHKLPVVPTWCPLLAVGQDKSSAKEIVE